MNFNFEAYNLEDLISDESFQRWAKSIGTIDEDHMWNVRYASSADMRELMNHAKLAILTLSRTEAEVDPRKVDIAWNDLNHRINPTKPKAPIFKKLSFAVAFSVLFICLTWLVIHFQGGNYVTYQTGYGQKKEIVLPDGSQITLNANSTLRTYDEWDKENRAVWLDNGEAYFQISKTKGKDRFVVHSNDFNVEVLGTKFNINMSATSTEVMLSEGKIRLSSSKENQIMKPGQLAIVDKSGSLAVREVNVSHYDAWLRNNLVFDNRSLTVVADLIEAQYGVSVYLADDIKNKMLAGEMPNGNLELLLKALEVTLDLNISKSGDAILITKNSP
ncbi:MAG: FecR domain-containing protein [Cyclobacteriaceae bacterium]